MPNNSEPVINERAFESAAKDLLENFGLNALLRLAEREIAVIAIKITKRCRLNDQQIEFADRSEFAQERAADPARSGFT